MDASKLPTDLPSLLPDTEDLRPPAPAVYGPVEYRTWRRRLERLDEILRQGRTEELFVRLALRRRFAECRSEFEAGQRPMAGMAPGEQLHFQRLAARALRLMVARTICGGSYRSFTARLADSSLLQWFCRLERVGWEIRIPGKSQLQRYQGMVGESELREVVEGLLDEAEEEDSALELAAPVELGTQFLDSTCVKLNIHYPTDWVLLRDATRTLMKATILIRRRGLKVRMREPRDFLRGMNGLAIEMAKQARRAGSRKGRKAVLRRMKRLVRTVGEHARRHRDLLERCWQETDLGEGEARQIIDRIDIIRERLPVAVKQAHERIIGGRQVTNEEKILSLYEGHAAVYVRGKAGAEVEFGSQLLLAEARSGLVVDWELVCGNPEADTELLKRRLERDGRGRMKEAVTDRGFDSRGTRRLLAERGVGNGMTPRDPQMLRQRLREEKYPELWKRRGQTEGRIGIFKNVFLGTPLLAKGYDSQARQVGWAALAHNLWLLTGMPTKRTMAVTIAA
jgi:hypothetical protein